MNPREQILARMVTVLSGISGIERAARNLDEEWGINHSFLFFELSWFHPTDDSLPIGDNSWAAGLGFVF